MTDMHAGSLLTDRTMDVMSSYHWLQCPEQRYSNGSITCKHLSCDYHEDELCDDELAQSCMYFPFQSNYSSIPYSNSYFM